MVQVQHPSNNKSSTRRWSASTLQCLLVSTTLFVLCLYLGLVLSFVRRHFLLHDEIALIVPPPVDGDVVEYAHARGGSVGENVRGTTEHAPVPHAAMKCLLLDNNDFGNDGDVGGGNECCFSWSVDLDEWRTHHPDWGVTRSERDAYCLTKFEEPKATFFRSLYELQWGAAVAAAAENGGGNDRRGASSSASSRKRRNCSDLMQNLQVSSGMGRSIKAVMDGFHTAFERRRPYQLNRLRVTSKWMYATNDTSSWGFCNTTDLNCYILPIGNCVNTYGVNDPVKGAGLSTPNYTWIYEYLMRFNHRAMYHIQQRMDAASHIENLGDNCTVIHVRRGDSGMPRGSHRKYVGLVEFIREGGIGPEDPVLILTDDETTIYEAKTFYPDYNWIYMDRPRVNITYGGWEGLIPSGDEVQEFVAIYAEMLLASRCNKMVHGHSGFIRELKAFCEMVRRGKSLPSQEYHLIKHKFGTSTEKKKCQSMGKHYCAERMIEEIYREAAEGLKNRKDPTLM